MKIATLFVALALLTGPAFATKGDIAFHAKTIYPEGVAYNPATRDFYVSSMRQGTIGRVTAKGTYAPFIKDAALVSSVGLLVDAARDRLLSCVSDPGVSVRTNPTTQKKLAKLVAFDLKTKKKLAEVDLGALTEGMHFCNDLTFDPEGNVYVTDSFSPLIYKVDADYEASIFAKDDRWRGDGFNLNGIIYHQGGQGGAFLLVARYNDGTLWKVRLRDPGKPEQVKLPEPLRGADGLILADAGKLIVIQNVDVNRVTTLETTDGWDSAKITSTLTSMPKRPLLFPTTGVTTGAGTYILNSRLNRLFEKGPKAANATWELIRL